MRSHSSSPFPSSWKLLILLKKWATSACSRFHYSGHLSWCTIFFLGDSVLEELSIPPRNTTAPIQATCLYKALFSSLSEGEGEAWSSRKKEIESFILYFSFQLKQRFFSAKDWYLLYLFLCKRSRGIEVAKAMDFRKIVAMNSISSNSGI